MARILFVHMGKGLGGSPKSLRYAIDACNKAGHDCYVACLESQVIADYFAVAGAKTIFVDELPYYVNSTTQSIPLNTSEYRKMRGFAKTYESFWKKFLNDNGPFDLVFLNSMVLCELIKPSKEHGCKVIQVVRETAQAGPSLDVMKELFNQSDTVLFISEYDKQLFDIKHTPCFVVPNVVERSLYEISKSEKNKLRTQHNIAKDQRVLLFTGGTSPIKGGEFLIDCISRLKTDKKVVLFFAGYSCDKSLRSFVIKIIGFLSRHIQFIDVITHFSTHDRYASQRIMRKINHFDHSKNISIRPIGFQKSIQNYYKMADICIVPYRDPHQARPIFEAGASKIPCLASDHACFIHEIIDDYNGFLAPYGNAEMWAEKMRLLLEDQEQCSKMGENNYKMTVERHDKKTNLAQLLGIITQVSI